MSQNLYRSSVLFLLPTDKFIARHLMPLLDPPVNHLFRLDLAIGFAGLIALTWGTQGHSSRPTTFSSAEFSMSSLGRLGLDQVSYED